MLCAVGVLVNSSAYAEDTNVSVGLGLRSDDLQWSIAGNSAGTSPNVLSELTWSKVNMVQLEVSAEGEVGHNWFLGGDFAYALAFAGDVQDSDYQSDNRTEEFSRSYSDADKSYASDYGLRVGYVLIRGRGRGLSGFSLMPLLGYAHKDVSMRMTNGVQVLSDYGFTVPLGPFSGLNSKYQGKWDGAWLGARIGFEPSAGSKFFVEYQHHSASYNGEANWNLRTDFQHPVSFKHETDATGNILILVYQSTDKKGAGWEVKLRREEWDSDSGVDTTYFYNGSTATTQLNEVTSESTSLVWRKIWVF